MIVVGTAGHIDHGKSAIVKRLTGTDPDRLPEEKKRGLTIDLGFAFYRTPQSETIAFVDVPGHERFVKNMIAGAGGIDAVMLVIAADDGWMPQSEEHFQVVRLLGVKHGLIVINKSDLVEPDWLELLQQDIHQHVQGSFLQDAPIFTVSAVKGDGFDKLRPYLDQMATQIGSRKDIGKARLFIDRSFIRQGIGGVVTGTLRGGQLHVGQTVAVWPSKAIGKVRSLQSSGSDVNVAAPGQRTAVSFTGIDRELLVRGGVVTDRTHLEYFDRNPIMALAVELLSNAPVALEDRRQVLCIFGTTEVQGEIRLFKEEKIKPGHKGIVFFKPNEPVYSLIGDHYIMRLPTPMVTLGGGRVLDHLRHFPRRRAWDRFDYLYQRQSVEVEDLVRSELKKRVLSPAKNLLAEADIAAGQIDSAVAALVEKGEAAMFHGSVYEPNTLANAVERFKNRLEKYLDNHPHLRGVPFEQLLQFSPYGRETTTILSRYAVENDIFARIDDDYTLAGRGMTLKGLVKAAYDDIMTDLRDDHWAPPKLSQLTAKGKPYRDAIGFILDSGEGHKCGNEFIFLSDAWNKIIDFIRDKLNQDGSLAVSDLRDKFGFTRKFTIPVLEETDRLRITRREGDVRVKGARFEE